MLEAEHTRTVRARASQARVWEELSTLDRLMRQIPEIAYFRLEPDGRTAQVSTRLTWGPIDWRFGTAALVESMPTHHLRWRSHAPSLQLEFEGTFELTPAPAGDETVLSYRGVLRCRHKVIGRLRGALASLLEGHVNRLADRVASLAAQHAEAETRLSRPPDQEPER